MSSPYTFTELNENGSTIAYLKISPDNALLTILDYTDDLQISNHKRFNLDDISFGSLVNMKMSLSGDVLMVAVPYTTTGKGYVDIFRVNDTTKEWERHTKLNDTSTQTDTFGYSIDMTTNGSILCIGVPTFDTYTYGKAHIYGYVNNEYVLTKKMINPTPNNTKTQYYGSLVNVSTDGVTFLIFNKNTVDMMIENSSEQNTIQQNVIRDDITYQKTEGLDGNMSYGINFFIHQFDDTVEMSVSASFIDFVNEDLTRFNINEADIVAFYEVSLQDMKNTFSFLTDSNDIDDAVIDGHKNVNTDMDIIYEIYPEYFPNINFAHAQTVIPETYNTKHFMTNLNDTPYGTTFNSTRSLLKHEYIRYLSSKLFNTIQGVDLFNNEQELKNIIVRKGNEVLNSILQDLSNASGMSNIDTDGTNIGREIILQILNNEPQRFKNLSINDNGSISFPFLENDTLIFNVSINSNENQHNLTGTNLIQTRVYRIVLIMKENPSNIEPNDLIAVNNDLNPEYNVYYDGSQYDLRIPTNTYPS